MGDKIQCRVVAEGPLGFAVFGGKRQSLSRAEQVFGNHRYFDPVPFRPTRGEAKERKNKGTL